MDQRLSTAEGLIADKSFAEAVQLLSAIAVDELDGIDRGKWYVLRAEANLYLGGSSAEFIDRGIELLRHTAETQWFGRGKFVKGWQLSAIGQHEQAKEMLLEAYASFQRCEDWSSAARTLNRLTYCIMQTGNLEAAATNLLKCIALYQSQAAPDKAAVVSLNLAYVRTLQGMLSSAISVYHESSAQACAAGDNFRCLYHYMSALPLTLLGNSVAARGRIAQAVPYLDTSARDRAIYLENLGLIELLDGNYLVAEKALTEGLEISLQIAPESALISQIKRLLGDLYVATKHWTKAKQYATEGLAVAEQINERLEIAACWRVLAQVACHHNRSDEAKRLFGQAIDLLNLIGARYELAVTRYLAGTSGLYVNGERTAILHLARAYFESEQIPRYLQLIERAIKAEPLVRKQPSPQAVEPTIIHRSGAMARLLNLAENVAQSDMSVLLTGETGTGKDLLARYLHYHSGRTGEFVHVNTTAIPADMVESELFGHTKGAYTGALTERVGLIEQAEHGTLYLDEIADATPELQAKLLQVIESRQVRRLGQNATRPVTCRFIAATNCDLEEAFKERRFRTDLYHRLNDISIVLPPLRERLEDIPVLVAYFLAGVDAPVTGNGDGAMADRLSALLATRPWPGNVRELAKVVRRMALSCGGDAQRLLSLAAEECDRSERDQLLAVLVATGWNRREAARRLGLSEATVRRRMAQLDLALPNPD